MKAIKLLSILALLPLQGVSYGSLKIDLNTNIMVTFQERVHYAHSMKCYWKKKGDDIFGHGQKDISKSTGIKIYNSSKKETFVSRTPSPIQYGVRSLVVDYKESQSIESKTLTVSLQDLISKVHTQGYDTSGCRTSNMTGVAKQGSIEGTVALNYTVPANVWLVKVKRGAYNGLFSYQNSGEIQGAINKEDDIQSETLIWTKPGDQLSQIFTIPKNTVPGHKNLGTFSITFEPVGVELSDSSQLKNHWKKIGKYLRQRLNSNDNARSKDISFLTDTSTLVRSSRFLPELLKGMGTQDISKMSDRLFAFAQSEQPSADELELHIRSMAAVLSYELALNFLSDLKPYCNTIKVDLPFVGKQQEMMGLRAAHYWMSRALNRIKYYDYKGLEAFLGEISRYESDGFTYKQVMANEGEREKLEKSFELLMRGKNLLKSPFRAALTDMKKLLKHFRSIGSDEVTTAQIQQMLNASAKRERPFIKGVFKTLDKFRSRQTSSIEISETLEEIEEFQKIRDELISLMSNHTRFLSIEGNQSTDSFLAQIESMLSHQINVFSHKLDIKFFEPIRLAYYNSDSAKTLSKTADQCIFGGL